MKLKLLLLSTLFLAGCSQQVTYTDYKPESVEHIDGSQTIVDIETDFYKTDKEANAAADNIKLKMDAKGYQEANRSSHKSDIVYGNPIQIKISFKKKDTTTTQTTSSPQNTNQTTTTTDVNKRLDELQKQINELKELVNKK